MWGSKFTFLFKSILKRLAALYGSAHTYEWVTIVYNLMYYYYCSTVFWVIKAMITSYYALYMVYEFPLMS